VRSRPSALAHFASGAHRDRSLAARATSSLPRTGSDDEHNDHDDDGNDEGGDGDRAGVHGVSEPVGINWRPYSVSPIVWILLRPERPPPVPAGYDFGDPRPHRPTGVPRTDTPRRDLSATATWKAAATPSLLVTMRLSSGTSLYRVSGDTGPFARASERVGSQGRDARYGRAAEAARGSTECLRCIGTTLARYIPTERKLEYGRSRYARHDAVRRLVD